ncbi:hypothetical protein D3C85_1561630 [compost metagenome]
MRGILADSQGQRASFAAAACTASPLQVVGWVRWDVIHGHHANAANVYPHLHCGRTAKQVQLASLEQDLVGIQFVF